ncbi:hypothetical protein ACFCZ3_19695 [Cellulosimicrobium cellulans]|uniref:hypothetical protein n=1 Tax=Cellulosimicrobium cellulans TaxID=1710 RepID=UPI0035DA51D6
MTGGATGAAQAAHEAQKSDGPGVKSREARSAALNLLDAPAAVRRRVIAGLTQRDQEFIFRETLRETGSLYGQWHDAPVFFIEDVLGETLWRKQQEVADACVTHKRVAVPAGFGVGKTFLAGRIVAWAGAVNPVGTMVIVSTATRFRQVRYQMWPHIRTAIAKGKLPGETDTTQWRAPDLYGKDVIVAYGFSAPDNDEAAMQGIHGTPKLFLVVDEAGGISRMIGRGTNNLLTGDATMLAIGNPAMNDPGSWFETLCAEGEDSAEPTTTTIRIATHDSPAITGEPTPICRACVPNLDGHTIAGGNPPHLPDKDWLDRTMREYGDPNHPYIVAKVNALFPKDSGNKIIPASWIEVGRKRDEPDGDGYVRLNKLGLEGETDPYLVKPGSWVRLGVDIAADGGDEFVISRAIGDLAHTRHVSSGSQNADSMVVSERVLEEIHQAERLAAALGSRDPVRVKIDTIGLGWGVVGNLKRWADVGRHSAQIVAVNVAEAPEREDDQTTMRPANKRAELWLAGRSVLQPDPSTEVGRLRLMVDDKTGAQLGTPNLLYNAAGMVLVESKKSMKARKVSSPDRAEALLLSIYEPFRVTRRRRGRGLIQG